MRVKAESCAVDLFGEEGGGGEREMEGETGEYEGDVKDSQISPVRG